MYNYKIRTISILILLVLANIGFSQNILYKLMQSDSTLDAKVDSIYNTLTEDERIAQMIITSAGELGKPEAIVKQLVEDKKVGGVIILKNEREKHKSLINDLNQISLNNSSIPLLFSVDAEPSLFSSRIKGAKKVKNTNQIHDTITSIEVAKTIDKEIKDLGFHINYAPVADISTNNAAITNRSYGSDPEKVAMLASAYMKQTHKDTILSTIKHFPGHGLVKGDTHKQSVYIDGELKELPVFKNLINDSALSVMVAHIVVKNNKKYDTEGLPSTLSRKIVTDLLKDELGFKGIVVTDALNIMKAVTIYENAPLMASKAGNDMLLMPINERKTIKMIKDEMNIDLNYADQIEKSIKKILKLKVILNLL